MSFELQEIGPCKKRAEFELTSKEVNASFDEVYGEICETINFPGFRKGKVPKSLVAKKYGKDIVGEVKEKLISKTFYDMVEEKSLDIISQPSFDEKGKEFQEDEGFTYSVSFDVKPKIELPEYKGIKLKKELEEVTEEKIKETQENLLKSHASLEEVEEGEIQAGDYPTLHINVEDENGEVLHHNHSFICAVEQNRLDLFSFENLAEDLGGLKKGDKKDLSYNVPEEFPAKEELAGKAVTLKVEVEEVKRLVEPEFNDEFLKKLGFDKEEDYLDTLSKMLEGEYTRKANENLKEQIYAYLDENVSTDLPEDTVKRHAEYLVNMKVYEAMRSGTPAEEAEAQREALADDAQKDAEREIKVGFTLGGIADKEKVFVTEREISQRVVQLAAQRQVAPEKLKEELEANHELSALRSQIKEEKT
ncbi:MAG: trigger factor, partial [Planctomycetes bacterium]|nr:trigger factor [Planctomycetota bacterium]